MIRTLTIENFKPFGGRHEVELAPFTMVLGPNSGGKSSLLQALLLMGQSFGGDDVRASRGGELVLRGAWTDLGSFDSLVHGHESSLPVTIGLTIKPNDFGRLPPQRDRDTELQSLIEEFFLSNPHGAEVTFQFDSSRRQIVPADFVLRLPGGGFPLEFVRSLRFENGRRFQPDGSLAGPRGGFEATAAWAAAVLTEVATSAASAPLRQTLETMRQSDLPIWFLQSGVLPGRMRIGPPEGFDDGLEEDFRSDTVVTNLMAVETIVRRCVVALLSAARSMEYIGPIRTPPERVGVVSGRSSLDMRADGAGLLDVLARRPDLVRRANDALQDLEIPYALSVASVESDQLGGAIGDLHALLLKDTRRNVDVAVADVGFGISQVLPIVIQAVAARDNTLIVQQPELHLHPALQLKLAEFLAMQVRRGPNQFVLETHSEHMVLRIQRLIRRGELDADDVAILFVDGSESVSRIKRIRLDDDGEFIDEWPAGFFEERLDELFEDEAQ